MHSIDRVTIDTPEQITLELPLAGIGSRFLALAFDSLLQAAVAVVVSIALALFAATSSVFSRASGGIVAAIIILFLFCVYWGYFALFETIWKGQTPGKRLVGIRVIKTNGRPINVYEAVGRNLLRAIDGFLAYGVGIIVMMLNDQHRRLGDFVAGTVVVHDKKSEELKPGWTMAPEPVQAFPEITRIEANELVLIETYLQRQHELDTIVRATTAQKILRLIESKTGAVPQPGQTVTDFLETIVRGVRDSARLR